MSPRTKKHGSARDVVPHALAAKVHSRNGNSNGNGHVTDRDTLKAAYTQIISKRLEGLSAPTETERMEAAEGLKNDVKPEGIFSISKGARKALVSEVSSILKSTSEPEAYVAARQAAVLTMAHGALEVFHDMVLAVENLTVSIDTGRKATSILDEAGREVRAEGNNIRVEYIALAKDRVKLKEAAVKDAAKEAAREISAAVEMATVADLRTVLRVSKPRETRPAA